MQTSSTLAPYAVEEAYEVLDAIERGNSQELKEELGDLMLQIALHSEIASEENQFDLDDVLATLSDKMIARHPHVFGDTVHGGSDDAWEVLKERERTAKGAASAMDGVARALPALLRAHKLQKRAARAGFDWPDTAGPRAKIIEEIAELEEAGSADMEEEAGDLLFAATNLVRAHGLEPESALRKANDKFERRFRAMEVMASGRFASLSLDEQERLWNDVKAQE